MTMTRIRADQIVTAGNVPITSEQITFTEYGGLAIRLTAGEDLITGNVVDVSSVTGTMSVIKILQNVPDPIGAVYEGVSEGEPVWIVVAGIAQVYFIGSTEAGQLARGFVTADGGFVAGQALAENVPTSPFSTDKHFYEIGHILETRTGAGLSKVVLHFN